MSLPKARDARIVLIMGTRPEAIKLAPVVLAIREQDGLAAQIWCTGQHDRWVPEMLAPFGLEPDLTLRTTDTQQGLGRLGGTLLDGLQLALREDRPDVVVIQGDTSSAFTGALAAAYAGIPVVHVEAGLRCADRRTPFPEEAHRRAISNFTDLHCVPTELARANLLAEGTDEVDIILSGNTVIDALKYVQQIFPENDAVSGSLDCIKKSVVVTCHRRENWNDPFAAICAAIGRIAERGDCDICFVVPPNPTLADTAHEILAGFDGVRLVRPMGYAAFIQLISRATLILTDSGGVQEEASALGIPLLVLRDRTERPEALATGTARLVGSSEEDIVAAANQLLDSDIALADMRVPCTLYGDGQAARRIAEAIAKRWGLINQPANGAQISADAAYLLSKVSA